jgi:PAS domain S-box-containing protein
MNWKTILDQSNLKIAQKGFILVLVPLILGLIFIGILLFLLNQAELARSREAHARKVISLANTVNAHALDGIQFLTGYVLTRSETIGEHYDQVVAKLPAEFQDLSEETRGDSVESKLVEQMRSIVERAVKLLNTLRKSNDREYGPNDVWYLGGVRTHLTYLLQQLLLEQHELIVYEESHRPSSLASDSAVRSRLKDALNLGIVIEIIMSFVLAAYFSRTITGRIKTLVENALRFKRREELHPTLHGSDELAQLDSAFHGMAKERNDAEELIKQSEARVRSILESMPVALLVTDPEGKIEAVNLRTEQMLGYASTDLVGKYLNKLLLEGSGNGQGASADQILKPASGRPIEAYARRNSGENLPVELSSSQLQMREGPRLLVTMLDVTERHEIERLKKEFVNMISHDLKTPLTSIVGNLALVSAEAFGPLTERGKHMVNTSEKQAERLISLINDLLLLEKMEAGGFELHVTRTDLAEILEQSKEAVVEAARERSIVIETPETEAEVYADSMRLIQVMVNLLSNAIKFSPDRGVVKVLVEEDEEAVKVQVIDQGRGIPLEHRKVIFEKFKQVELSDSREKGGTGLGLPICKLIIEKHGGSIGVDSEEGKGSTFWFQIPKRP